VYIFSYVIFGILPLRGENVVVVVLVYFNWGVRLRMGESCFQLHATREWKKLVAFIFVFGPTKNEMKCVPLTLAAAAPSRCHRPEMHAAAVAVKEIRPWSDDDPFTARASVSGFGFFFSGIAFSDLVIGFCCCWHRKRDCCQGDLVECTCSCTANAKRADPAGSFSHSITHSVSLVCFSFPSILPSLSLSLSISLSL
jgi:hypothetical protein